jgi:hypothetical protein
MSEQNARLFLVEELGLAWTESTAPTARFRGDSTLGKLFELKEFLESKDCPSHMSWYTRIPVSFFKYESRLLPMFEEVEMHNAAQAYSFTFSPSRDPSNASFQEPFNQLGNIVLSAEDSGLFVVCMAAVYVYNALLEGLLGNIVPMQELVKEARPGQALREPVAHQVDFAEAPFSPALDVFEEAPFSPALDTEDLSPGPAPRAFS